MPFFGTIWILPKSRLVLNFGAIFIAWGGPAKMAQKFEISLDFGRIQIIPKNGIFNGVSTTLRYKLIQNWKFLPFCIMKCHNTVHQEPKIMTHVNFQGFSCHSIEASTLELGRFQMSFQFLHCNFLFFFVTPPFLIGGTETNGSRFLFQ